MHCNWYRIHVISYAAGVLRSGDDLVQLGLKYEVSESAYIWEATGEPVTYSNWAPVVADSADEECVMMETDEFSYFEWIDIPCDFLALPLCYMIP